MTDMKPKRGILVELQRSSAALWERLSDPIVILLMAAAVAAAMLSSSYVTSKSTSCSFQTHEWNLSPNNSRFHILAYPMPGPIRLEHLSRNALLDFTLDERIPVHAWHRNDVGVYDLSWSSSMIDRLISVADKRDHAVNTSLCAYGPECNKAFFEALSSHPIQGQNVLIVGSVSPWLEAICLSFKVNSTTTVDFNPPTVTYPRMKSLSIAELDATDEVFDSVFSYSSLEHDGLGRYGDPLNPSGDLLRMKKLMGLVRRGGKLFLGVPIGPDFLLFNAHRVYGPIRFPLLIEGWQHLGSFGEDLQAAFRGNFKAPPMCIPRDLGGKKGCYSQPVHVLTKK